MSRFRFYFRPIFLVSVFFFISISCFFSPIDIPIDVNIPEGIPISEFIIGRWATENIYRYDGSEYDNLYEFEFIYPNTLKFIELNSEGYLLDGWTSTYYFVDDKSIFVSDERIPEGYHIKFERAGQKLIAYRTFEKLIDKITLIRIEHKYPWQVNK